MVPMLHPDQQVRVNLARPGSVNELRRWFLGLSYIQRKNQRPTLRAVPACGFRFAQKVTPAPFAVLGIQNLRTCRDPMGLILTQSLPASVGIAPAWRRGMGSQSHWQFRDHKYIHSLRPTRSEMWVACACVEIRSPLAARGSGAARAADRNGMDRIGCSFPTAETIGGRKRGAFDALATVCFCGRNK